jgi:hypothetical protein
MSRLFVFGRFAHDAEGILAAVYRFALMSIELSLHVGICELCGASLADAQNGPSVLSFYDPELSLRHDCSLAQLKGRS